MDWNRHYRLLATVGIARGGLATKRIPGFRDILNKLIPLYNTVLSFVPALFFLATGIFNTYLALSSPYWPSTTGEVYAIIDYDSYTAVLYAYEAGGMKRDSKRVSFSLFPESATITSEYWEGQQVRVYYHAQFPSHAVLIPGWGWHPVAFLVLGVIFVPMGWLVSNWFRGLEG